MKKLSAGMSILITVVLILSGLCLGTVRGFQKDRAEVTGLLQEESGLADVLMYRGADGLNLWAVAQRHIPGTEELENLRIFSGALAAPGGKLSEKQELDGLLDESVSNVVTLLEGTESYQASQRDQNYVTMLKNDMSSLAGQSFYTEYSSAAEAFNGRLQNTFMGKVAGFLGVKPCTADQSLEGSAMSVRLPDRDGVVTDDANVLDSRTIEDIEEYADMVEDETDVKIHVALVHFTDGMDVKQYGETLFNEWGLDDEDMLILGVIGQEGFTMVLGSDVQRELNTSSVDNLLYTSTSFSSLFAGGQYDAAFGNLFQGMTALFNKEYREDMEMGSLFEHVIQLPANSQNAFGSGSWMETLGNIGHVDDAFEASREEENGLTVVHWILIVGLIMIIINGSDPVRKAKRKFRR